MKYSDKLIYIEQKENGYRTIFRNSKNSFDMEESDDLFMELFDIPTFKQAIQGRKIKVINLRNNTIKNVFIKGQKWEDYCDSL